MSRLFGSRFVVVGLSLGLAVAVAAVVPRSPTSPSAASLSGVVVRRAEAQVPFYRRTTPASSQVHSFYFTRGMYSGSRRSWSTDAPQADRWIAMVMDRLTLIDVSPYENFVALDDPDLRRYPFLYILEVGGMRLRDSEVTGLREYLLRGGFVMVDDFWGTYEWRNWEREIMRVLPEYEIVEIPLTHQIFSTIYQLDEIVQVPSVGNVQRGQTHESDGIVPHVRGIFDDQGRLMVVINWNTDIGDAWEWAEAPYYPLVYSTYAYQVAANTFMYAMTH